MIRQTHLASLGDAEVISAGTETLEGTPANPVIKHLAQLNGFSLSQHLSQPFKRKIARKADLVLTMENSQRDVILKRYPKLKGHVFNVRDFGHSEPISPPEGISDPTGRGVEDFKEFLDIAKEEAERVLNVLCTKGLP